MAKSHRNRHQQAAKSQRPAHQQASVRPAVGGEAPQDNVRVPSPATAAQSRQDATLSDPDRYIPNDGAITDSDARPAQATDLAGGDDTVNDDLSDDDLDHVVAGEEAEIAQAEDGAEFNGFADPTHEAVDTRGHKVLPTTVSLTAQQQLEEDNKLVPVLPRRTVMRTRIGNQWWNFIKGQEQFVPNYIREHLAEKGVI